MAFAVTSPTPTLPSAPALSEVVSLSGGDATVLVRPIELMDAFRLRRMFERLSPETVYHRFFAPIPQPRDAMLRHLASVDHHSREGLVAVTGNELVGLAQYDSHAGSDEAEVAIAVEDAWQNRGLGTLLMQRLGRLGARRGLKAFTAVVMGENTAAVRFLKRLNADTDVHLEKGDWTVYAPLQRRDRSPAGRPAAR